MLALIKQRPPSQATDFPGFTDLHELLAIPKTQADTRLWVDRYGRLVCFAILDRDQASANLIIEIAPGWQADGLPEQVMGWVETSIRQTSPAPTGTFLLEAGVRSDNPARICMLEELGFERQTGGAVHMERFLSEPIERPQLAPGFFIRPTQAEAEAEAWVRLHRAAFGTEHMTLEYRLAMIQTPSYNPDLDLVAIAPDGGLAAYCVCFINADENVLTGRRIGHTDPIATHPDFRRRGLSKALLLTGLSLLRARSMDIAALGTDSRNIAMLRTAGSVGYRITQTVHAYTKTIDFGKYGKG
jgi:ribosomal protein S18 acetylase RimI-like enzyme